MTDKITMSTVVVAIEDQMARPLGDEAVVLDLKAGAYYGLNAVGLSVWRLLQQPRGIAEIRDAILDEFDVERGQCEADVVRLLEDLIKANLIEVRTP